MAATFPDENEKMCDLELEKNIFLQMEMDLLKNKTFDNIFGVEETVTMLKEHILLPPLFPNLFKNQSKRSLMLFGVPGSGKSHLVSAAATARGAKLLVFNVYLLQSATFRNLSEKCIKTIFKVAADNAPSILCFEDFEIFSRPELTTAKVTFINEMHNFLSYPNDKTRDVMVVGVTHKPEDVNLRIRRQFLRPHGSYVNLPDKKSRLNILKSLCNKDELGTNHCLHEEDFEQLAAKTHGFTGADLKGLIPSALMVPIKRLSKASHFKKVCIKTELTEKHTSNLATGHESEATGATSGGQANDVGLPKDDELELASRYESQTQTLQVKRGGHGDFNTGGFDDTNNKEGETFSNTMTSVRCQNNGATAVSDKDDIRDDIMGNDDCDRFVACDADDIGAIPLCLFDIPEEKLHIEDLSVHDFNEALNGMKASVSEEEVEKMLQFQSQFCGYK